MGRDTGFRVKKGREEIKSDDGPGWSHRYLTLRGVGGKRQEKRWAGVWGALLPEGRRESGALLTLCRKLLGEEQYPVGSWETVERKRRGRSFSSSATAGGGVCRKLLGEREAIARVTASSPRGETPQILYLEY